MFYKRRNDVACKVARLKWDWAGHLSGIHLDKGPKIYTEWEPIIVGLQYAGKYLEDYDNGWKNFVWDKVVWKELGRTFLSCGTTQDNKKVLDYSKIIV